MPSTQYENLPLNYCPHCGKASLNFVDGKKWHCTSCHFSLYHNVAAAVAVVISSDEEIMLVRRAKDPGKGLLDLPGGFSDAEETAETTCRRELREELQLDIPEEQFSYLASHPNIYPYKGIIYHTMDLFYQTEMPEESLMELDTTEVSEFVWVPKNAIPYEELAFESQKNVLKKLFGG